MTSCQPCQLSLLRKTTHNTTPLHMQKVVSTDMVLAYASAMLMPSCHHVIMPLRKKVCLEVKEIVYII